MSTLSTAALEKEMCDRGRECGVQPRMKLSSCATPMVPELMKFFNILVTEYADVTHATMAIVLDTLGVQSADGRIVHEVHVGIAMRKCAKKSLYSWSENKNDRR